MGKRRRYFTCLSCSIEPTFRGTKALKKHLEEVHPGTPELGTRKGIEFLDGSGWYRNTFKWKLGEIEFIEVDTNA
jgi:hypothetical protein